MQRIFEKFGALVELIEARQVIEGSWIENASLFVMPGGADLPYCRFLNGRGNRNISSFVENGGAYLGVCAGGYYAGRRVEFAVGTDLEVLGERELSFFPGSVKGPTFPPFQYSSSVGMRAVKLSSPFLEESPVCFYHGGGHFCISESREDVEVLARYSEAEGNPPAIVRCLVERGIVLLSGVHFEYDPHYMEVCDVVDLLKKEDSSRVALVEFLIKQVMQL